MNALHIPRLTRSDPSPCTPVLTQCPVWRVPSAPCPCSACPSVSAGRYIWRPPQTQPQTRVRRGPLWAWPEAAPQETHGPCPGGMLLPIQALVKVAGPQLSPFPVKRQSQACPDRAGHAWEAPLGVGSCRATRQPGVIGTDPTGKRVSSATHTSALQADSLPPLHSWIFRDQGPISVVSADLGDCPQPLSQRHSPWASDVYLTS